MRSVVITGISRGLGAALFERLAADPGTRLVGLGRSFTAAQRARADAEPDRVRLVEVDFSAADLELGQAMDLGTRGTAHAVLLINAGTVEPVGAVGTVTGADLATSVTVNLTAPMVLANAFVAALPAGVRGSVLYVSSGAAVRPVEGWAAYCAAKAGGEMFFRVLAAERPDLRVASVNPGRMDTGMQDVLRGSEFPTKRSYVEAYERGELLDPDEVAARIISEHVTDG